MTPTQVRYLLQLELPNGTLEMEGAETSDRDMLHLLEERGALYCLKNKARSYAIVEHKNGRKRQRIIRTGCGHSEIYDYPS